MSTTGGRSPAQRRSHICNGSVSYFEWVKNLTHIPFGLMERRHHEASHKILARSLEAMTGASFPLAASSFLNALGSTTLCGQPRADA